MVHVDPRKWSCGFWQLQGVATAVDRGSTIPLLEMTSLGRSFSVNRSIEFEKLHGSLLVYCCDFQRARSNLDVFDNLWCARSVQQEFSHA